MREDGSTWSCSVAMGKMGAPLDKPPRKCCQFPIIFPHSPVKLKICLLKVKTVAYHVAATSTSILAFVNNYQGYKLQMTKESHEHTQLGGGKRRRSRNPFCYLYIVYIGQAPAQGTLSKSRISAFLGVEGQRSNDIC